MLSVRKIYNYYKYHGYQTIVMGASFRNIDEIEALAGCDCLTVSPTYLDALSSQIGELPRSLQIKPESDIEKLGLLDERSFRWMLNEDAMASEKLAEGIRVFGVDQLKLENLIAEKV